MNSYYFIQIVEAVKGWRIRNLYLMLGVSAHLFRIYMNNTVIRMCVFVLWFVCIKERFKHCIFTKI